MTMTCITPGEGKASLIIDSPLGLGSPLRVEYTLDKDNRLLHRFVDPVSEWRYCAPETDRWREELFDVIALSLSRYTYPRIDTAV